MMKIMQVNDIDFDSILNNIYDISFFSSGFETRSTYIPSLLNKENIFDPIVIGFREKSDSISRLKNDQFYCEHWNLQPFLSSSDNEVYINEMLNKINLDIDKPLKIIVDYSSMSRLWYAAVLNWARLIPFEHQIIIDFVYSRGKYREEKQPMVIQNMISIPGCEGKTFRQRESIAVFGLGFHGLAALCVLDQLEADIVYTFIASSESSEEYYNKTYKWNNELINSHLSKGFFKLPLASVETSYRFLAETIAQYRFDGEITLVPMGPKPHVLASILLAMRFQEVACLRVNGNSQPLDVQPTEEVVATRVIFSN